MLEFKQVTLNCVRDKNVLCYFVARNEAKVSIVSFFIEFDIHWELNVVQIVFCFSERVGCLDLTLRVGEKKLIILI